MSNVALHRGQHDGALLRALDPLHQRLQVGHAFFIVSADWRMKGSCILPAPNSSPTVFIPSSSSVLMMSKRCSASSSSASRLCLSPSTIRSFRRLDHLGRARLAEASAWRSAKRAMKVQGVVAVAAAVEDQVLGGARLLRRSCAAA